MVNKVAITSDVQSKTAQNINASINSISSVVENSSQRIQQIARSSENLNKLTHNLLEQVSWFNISSQPNTIITKHVNVLPLNRKYLVEN